MNQNSTQTAAQPSIEEMFASRVTHKPEPARTSMIEVLDEKTHRELTVDFDIARNAARKESLQQIAISEFHSLMFHYPIVFVKSKETGEFVCSVLLGVSTEANLLDSVDLSQAEGVPLNIRRLPLIAIAPPADATDQQPLIGINMASPGIGQGEYFMRQKSASFDAAIASLAEVYAGYKETKAYVKKVVELDLISRLKAELVYKEKPSITLNGLYGIDASKIAKINESDEKTKALFLDIASYVYAQHFSLYNMKKFNDLSS